MIITLCILYFTLQLPVKQHENLAHGARRLEYPPAILLLISITAPLFSLNLGGDALAWNHPIIIILLCLTPALIGLFYYAETHIAVTPIIPKRFIRDRNIAMALACTLPMKLCFDQASVLLPTE